MTALIPWFVLLLFRNLLGPWLFYFVFYKWKPRNFSPAKNLLTQPSEAQVAYEKKMTYWHTLSDIAAFGFTVLLIQEGYTQVYWNLADYGLLYAGASFVFLFFAQDFYFYVTHRWLHTPFLYKHFHSLHHKSRNTTPWSAFSVHPVENAIELLFSPLVLLLVPLHPTVLLTYLFVSTFLNFNGHSGFEINPTKLNNSGPTAWVGTSTSHNLHHQYFTCHYSFYFTIWDKLFKTEHPTYTAKLQELTDRKFSIKKAFLSREQ